MRSRRRRIVLESKKGLGRPHRVKKNKKLNGPAHCCSSRGGHGPCTACNDLRTCRALPDADRLALHSVLKKKNRSGSANVSQNPHSLMPEAFACLAAERAGVPCVLGNFHLEGRGTQVKSAFLFGGGGPVRLRVRQGSHRTFLTCLRKEAP